MKKPDLETIKANNRIAADINERLLEKTLSSMECDGDFAHELQAKHFSKGSPVCYVDSANPGYITVLYPDGRKELKPCMATNS